jgi:Flp pilus assembly protein TadD
MVLLAGCASQVSQPRDNIALRQTIYESVPSQWRAAADAAGPLAPLAVPDDLRDYLATAVRSNLADRDRMLALVRTIVLGDGMGLTYNPDATYTAAEAFRSGEGNCLGFSNLLVASARELGLNARFELVSHPLRWQQVDGVLVVSLHVRVTSFAGARRMVFDFYPLPIEDGYSTSTLLDDEALAHHLNNLAADAMRDGENARAYALLHQALEASPGTAFIWSNLGILLSRQDLVELAESAFLEALAISPDTLSAMSNLQAFYVGQGRLVEARQLQEQLAEYRDRNPYYHFALGEVAYNQDDFPAALEHLEKAIDLKSNDRNFYHLQADIYRKLGRDEAASRALRKASSIRDLKVTSYSLGDSPEKLGTRIPQQ